MTKELFRQAVLKFTLGFILVGVLIFVPAGTLHYWNGLIFMGVLFIPMFCAGIMLMIKNPELLRKRLNAREKQMEQNIVLKLSGLMFIVGFVVCGLDFRFGWLALSQGVVIGAVILFLLAYLMLAEVIRENTYLSRTIEIQENQKVIDTGLYGVVRHPMYSATVILFLAMPLILGSLFGFIIFLTYPLIIAKRIRNEEAVLEEGLDGYREYKEKVKYRLIPFVW